MTLNNLVDNLDYHLYYVLLDSKYNVVFYSRNISDFKHLLNVNRLCMIEPECKKNNYKFITIQVDNHATY